MESRSLHISLKNNPSISVKVISGHFTTSSSHMSHYVDVSSLKSSSAAARAVAKEMALPYLTSTLVETIICMERMEVIGAYLAEELLRGGYTSVCGGDINVITPINNGLGSLYFQSSTVKCLLNKHIVLLVTSITSGRTLDSALDCISYYGGKLAGISSLFLASPEKHEQSINSLFTSEDIPGYTIYRSRKCELCGSGKKLNALISSEGYTKL